MGSVIRSGAVAAILVGLGACSSPATQTSGTASGGTTATASTSTTTFAGTGEIARFTATTDKKNRKLTFTRIASPSASAGGLKPESINSVPDPFGENGSPPAGDVDLVSTNCVNGFEATPSTPTFQCDVELISGFSRNLANVYAQISAETLNGTTTSNYDGTNSSPELNSTNDGTLTQAHGLWLYGNSSFESSTPVIGPVGGGFNTATVTWQLQNPDDANAVYTIVVYATEFWADYTLQGNAGDGTYGNMGHTDACSGGTSTTASKTTITLPFDFTLYNTNSTTLNLCLLGEVTLGATGCVSTLTTPSDLSSAPQTSIGNPVLFSFWDRLKFGSSTNDQAPDDSTKTAGRICYQTLGTAPNRMEVVEWRNMDFTAAPDVGSSLDFEMYLYEGSNEIDLYYTNMANASGDTSGRASCTQCFLGLQGKDNSGYDNGSTALTGEGSFESTGVSNGLAVSFLPVP